MLTTNDTHLLVFVAFLAMLLFLSYKEIVHHTEHVSSFMRVVLALLRLGLIGLVFLSTYYVSKHLLSSLLNSSKLIELLALASTIIPLMMLFKREATLLQRVISRMNSK